MAETKKFVLEGEVSLAYFADEQDSKHVLLKPKDGESDKVETASSGQDRLEAKIASELDFPSDAEFDQVFTKLDDLREKGLRPAEGVPIVSREGVNLRITVEVLS